VQERYEHTSRQRKLVATDKLNMLPTHNAFTRQIPFLLYRVKFNEATLDTTLEHSTFINMRIITHLCDIREVIYAVFLQRFGTFTFK